MKAPNPPNRLELFARLFWAHDRTEGWCDLHADGDHAVIGRHSECDVVLLGPPEMSLRHLVAMSVRFADGLGLRLLDLHTLVPFFCYDDTPRSSIVAFGPIAVRLADYVLGAIPLLEDPQEPGRFQVDMQDLVPVPVEERADLDPKSAAPSAFAVGAQQNASTPGSHTLEDAAEGGPRSPCASHVTSLPPPSKLDDLPAARPRAAAGAAESASNRNEPVALSDDPYVGRLGLRCLGRQASLRLTGRELDLGVLVGRSHRCVDEGLQAVLDLNISRGHLLLLRQQERLEAFDLCSTQGTFRGGRRIRRCQIEDDGTTLELASRNPLTLRWSAHE